MRWYTNVKQLGNKIYVRGHDGEKKISHTIEYNPTFYVTSNIKTKYKTLDGKYVKPIQPGSIKESKQYIEKYKDVEGFDIYGNESAVYQYISDNYPEEHIDYDISKMSIWAIDIEVSSENGFPDPKNCDEEILLITIQDYTSKEIYTWGTKPLKKKIKNHNYFYCKDETALIYSFLNFWQNNTPEIITGWNCIPLDSNIWTYDKIVKLKNVKVNQKLYDSTVTELFPKSNKTSVVQKLSNGATIKSSYDHIFPYVLCDKNKYTNLDVNSRKTNTRCSDMSVKEAMESEEEKFLYVPTRKNSNLDNPNYTYDQCYLLGLIYTDGSIKNKNKLTNGFTFYQSDCDFLSVLKEQYSINNKLVGPYNGCFHVHIPHKIIGNVDPIYNEKNEKEINLELISTFSEKQFYMFLSGLLDGDGTTDGKSISLCNYNNDLEKIYELSLWNGIFSSIHKSKNTIRFIDIDLNEFNLLKFKRWEKIDEIKSVSRDSSELASLKRFRKIDGGYLVRVVSFDESEISEMMDIGTDTHYFISNGVKTHNCMYYDFPYIIGRMNRVIGEKETKKLSPYNWISNRDVEVRIGEKQTIYDIFGVSIVDYLDLYKKYSFKKPENFRLDTIAYNELGQNKLDHSQYETFKDFYSNDWETFVEYNVIDTELVNKLEDKLHMVELAIMLAYDSKTNFEDVFYQVRMWDTIIYNYLRKKNIVIPLKTEAKEKSSKFAGAFVKEPIPGSYDYVVSMDLTSLYPHIMMGMNISPDTLVDERISSVSVESILNKSIEFPENLEYSVTPNGSMYRKDKMGFLPELLEKMFQKRKLYKDKMKELKKEYEKTQDKKLKKMISMYSVKEQSIKVCLNSCYGATGNPYFRFYDLRNAEAVTYTGQLAIRWIEKKFNEYFNKILKTQDVDYVVYCDTDSAFLNLKPLVDLVYKNKTPSKLEIIDFLDKIFSTSIQDYVDQSYRELAEYLNAYAHKLHMKREKITDRAVFIAKKRYIANVWDNEGVRYSKPELSMTGIEAIRSSTPSFCRDKIKTAIQLIMSSTEEELISYIEKTKIEFFSLSAEEVSFTKSVNELTKFKSNLTMYTKGTPIHVRGSILYNYYVKTHKLQKKYSMIKNGEKIKFCYLKMPNPIQENVIAFIQTLPSEFKLDKYIDYETQFDKTFLKPLKAILDIIGWETEKKITLDSFFV